MTWTVVLAKIPTGCRVIDDILSGGVASETVNLIYGEPETGKTTFAMQCAVNCAWQRHKTLFVDCDGTFSVRRLSQLAYRGAKEVAELIILIKPKDFHEQTAVIDKLGDYINDSFGLVVIDTINSLYRLNIAESPKKSFELNRELNRQIALLAQTAKTRKASVLVTSQVRSVLDQDSVSVEPVATRVLKFWADTVIALRPTESPGVITAVLEKSLRKVKPMSWRLRIEQTGIHESLDR